MTQVSIYVSGRIHGERHWEVVPRVGELVWADKGSNADMPMDGWLIVRQVKYYPHRVLLECEFYAAEAPLPRSPYQSALG